SEESDPLELYVDQPQSTEEETDPEEAAGEEADPEEETEEEAVPEEETRASSTPAEPAAYEAARKNSQLARERMQRSKRWKKDEVYCEGDFVFLYVDFDNNQKTRKMALSSNIDDDVYVVKPCERDGFVDLQSTKNADKLIRNVSTTRIVRRMVLEDTYQAACGGSVSSQSDSDN
ncbi:MAG: uncharacterized protein A8A55_3307, partial [Amphiamblys sp. WSBS2006]